MPTTVVSTIKSAGGDYTSLSAWEAAKQADLTVADQIQEAQCYAFNDSTALVIDGSTTDSTRYMKIGVVAGEGHSGKPDSSKARMIVGIAGACVEISDDFVRFSGHQISNNADDNGLFGFKCNAGNTMRIERCLVTRENRTFTFGNGSVGFKLGVDRTADVFLINNVVYNWDFGIGKGSNGYELVNGAGPPGKAYIYNCLAHVPNGVGFSDGFFDVVLKNCIAFNCTVGFSANTDSNSDYNSSTDTSAPGAHARNSQSYSFVDDTNFDYHLTGADTGALGFGTNLSADTFFPFPDDFDGDIRTLWSIGPDDGPPAGQPVTVRNFGVPKMPKFNSGVFK